MAVDQLISLYTVTAITATFTSSPVTMPSAGTPRRGLWLRAIVDNVTTNTATPSTLALSLQVTRDGSTTWLSAGTVRNHTLLTSDSILAAGEYYGHFVLPDISATGATYPQKVRVVGTITGSAPSFDVDVQIALARPS